MASNYPDSFDSLDDPAGTDPLSNPAHAALHVSENDAIEAVQATLGLNPEGSYATVAERMGEVDTAVAAAQAAQVAAELAQAAAEGASTDAGDAANLAEDWAVQLGDPVSGGEYSAKYHAQAAAASVLDAQDAVGLAADSAAAAFTALGNANAQVTASRQARRFGADGSVLTNLPMQVDPAESLLKTAVWWIDAAHSSASGQSVSNLGWGGAALDAQLGSTGSADSNDPKFLDWDGENYVYLPGVAGNYLSVPDEAALDITGDIDIRVRVALDDWTPAVAMRVFGKFHGGTNNASYSVKVDTDGKISYQWSPDGTIAAVIQKTSTVATAFADGTTHWLRVTHDVDNGASGNDVKFYTSTDGVSWTQLGATVTTAGVASIFSGVASIEVGTRNAGANEPSAGSFYRAIIKNGIDGPTVLDVDCSQITSGSATSFTARTGQTVTINRSTSGRKSVAVTQPCWLFGTDDYLEVADGSAGLLDFPAADSGTVLAVVRQWATPVSDGTYIYKRDTASSLAPGWGISSNGTGLSGSLVVEDTADVTALRSTPVFAAGSTAVLAMRIDRSTGVLDGATNGSFGAQTPNITGIADLSNTAAMRVGRRSAFNSNYQDFEGIAFAVFRRALSAEEIRLISDYYQGNGYEPISPAKYPSGEDLPFGAVDGSLVFQQDSNELLLRQGGNWNGVVTEASVLRSLPQRPDPAELLLREAVWWIDSAHWSATD